MTQELAHELESAQSNCNYIVAKLDTERAYDQMQWAFIEVVLFKFVLRRDGEDG